MELLTLKGENKSFDILQNGYDLVHRVLYHSPGGVEALFNLANKQETGWLEFKASTRAIEGFCEPWETDDDMFWNVAKAVISMLNGFGGVVIIGITDNGKVIGCGSCHESGRIPAEKTNQRGDFLKTHINEQIIYPKNGWKTKKGSWSLKKAIPPGFVIPEIMKFKDNDDKEVIVLQIRPLPKEHFPLYITQKNNHNQFSPYLIYRYPGQLGQIEPISDPDTFRIIQESHNPVDQYLFSYLWNKFIENIENKAVSETPPSTPAIEVNWNNDGTRAAISVVATHSKAISIKRTLNTILPFQGSSTCWHVSREEYVDRIIPELDEICGHGCCPPVLNR